MATPKGTQPMTAAAPSKNVNAAQAPDAERPVRPITLSHIAGIDLGAAFKSHWKPVRRSPAYGMWLSIIASAMLIVPLLYLAVVAATIGLTGWHAMTHVEWLKGSFSGRSGVPSRSAIVLGIICYIGPIIAGLGLLLVLLRPLFMSSGQSETHFTIEPSEEPALHAFVSELCRYIGAPEPKRIDIDSSVNASASFRRGLASIFSRGDLVLTIGTPLVAGMSLNQFAGVLAHEFGHFTQGAGMRATYIIHTINTWLYRIVVERSVAEMRLREFAQTERSGDAVFVAMMFQFVAWITRLVFMVLLYIAAAISGFMSRQMEYDADRHQARLIGVSEFKTSWRRMFELQEGMASTSRELGEFIRKKQLPDDLATLIASASKTLGSDARLRIDEQLLHPSDGIFSTHPAPSQRIRATEKGGESGTFSSDQPASILFRNFEDICRKASYAQYKHEIEADLYGFTLVSTQALHASQSAMGEQATGFASYAGFTPPDWRPILLQISTIAPCENPKDTFQKLKNAKKMIAQLSQQANAAVGEFLKADQTLMQCEQADGWLAMERGATPRKFALPGKDRHAIAGIRDQARNKSIAAAGTIDEISEAVALRITCALRILHTQGSESKIPSAAELRKRSKQLVATMQPLRATLSMAQEIREGLARAEIIAPSLEEPKHLQRAKEALRPISDTVRNRLDDVRCELGGTPYPFETPGGEMSLGHRVVGDAPGWRDFEAIFSTASTVVDRYPQEARRIIAELASIAQTVEDSLQAKQQQAAVQTA
jgi:Zn-dependent protease with chaperone function